MQEADSEFMPCARLDYGWAVQLLRGFSEDSHLLSAVIPMSCPRHCLSPRLAQGTVGLMRCAVVQAAELSKLLSSLRRATLLFLEDSSSHFKMPNSKLLPPSWRPSVHRRESVPFISREGFCESGTKVFSSLARECNRIPVNFYIVCTKCDAVCSVWVVC